MIKICLDTNAFQDNWTASGEAFTFLAEFIKSGLAEVFISEVSILEHVNHYREEAPGIEAKLKSDLASCAKLIPAGTKGFTLPPFYSPPAFEKCFRERLTELGIQTLAIPQVPHAELVTRDLARRRPFVKTGKGYRDALTWLAFLGAVDLSTKQAIYVTNDINDHCNEQKSKLHPELTDEILSKNAKCKVLWFPTPKKLVDEFVKPLLKKTAEDKEKTEKILKRIQGGTYKGFALEDVVNEGLEDFETQEADGTFYAKDVPLEEPVHVTMVESPNEIEATDLYRLSNGSYVCQGTAEVVATVEGFVDKLDAFELSERGSVYVSTTNWNEQYSEVEVSNVPVRLTFSFQFEDGFSDISKFEVTGVESNQ
ncbi:MAG TPA: PIN domain-containing protein [Terracidiphilus sp.]|nr:PIN domain-containing protein [Terracidiphilus sp.]